MNPHFTQKNKKATLGATLYGLWGRRFMDGGATLYGRGGDALWTGGRRSFIGFFIKYCLCVCVAKL